MGTNDGRGDGFGAGTGVGLGKAVGMKVGTSDGRGDGFGEGTGVGIIVGFNVGSGGISAQQRTSNSLVGALQLGEVLDKVDPGAMKYPSGHSVLLHTNDRSNEHPVFLASSFNSSADVHKRAPMLSQKVLAVDQKTAPLQLSAVSLLPPHTRVLPNAPALIHPRSPQLETERGIGTSVGANVGAGGHPPVTVEPAPPVSTAPVGYVTDHEESSGNEPPPTSIMRPFI